MSAEKVPCHVVSKAAFLASRAKLVVTIRVHGSGEEVGEWVMSPKEFSTHSLGWGLNEPVAVPLPESITVDGRSAERAMLGLNLTLANSKDVPATAPAAAGAA